MTEWLLGYRPAMSPSLKVGHAARYAALGRLLLKHHGAVSTGALDASGIGDDGIATTDASALEDAKELVRSLVEMGPTFIKLGQLLSTRTDLLPPVYLEELSHLRDDVAPLEDGTAERVIEEELGVRVSKAFGCFDREPIGAASLGQVHRATMRDGRPVAVKVQRPGIRGRAVEDMEVVAELAGFLQEHSSAAARVGFASMAEEFRTSLMEELDYRRELENLRLLGDLLGDYDQIVVPRPIEDYSTSRVLTMEFVSGRSVASISPLARLELDCAGLAEQLIRAYLDQILVHGFLHADPHPGNVLLTDDGRLALVDLGMVARLAPEVQEALLRLFLAISGGEGVQAADALEHLGTPLDDFERGALRARVGALILDQRGATVGDLRAGRLLGALTLACSASGLQPRSELTLLGRALLSLDEVARLLDPGFELDPVIKDHATQVMQRRMLDAASPTRVLTAALDATDFAERLPARMNKVLDALAEGKLTISLEGLNEPALMRGVQKLANRLAAGVLIAALLLTAALFSGSHANATLWGYPVLTIVFLGLAILVTSWLVVGMARRDLPQGRKRRPM